MTVGAGLSAAPATGEVLRYAAFTEQGAGGNPAGVVLDARGLDDAARLAIAAEVGYSETAFVEPTGATGQYRVRYFSPQVEVPFCGHATIATAVALAERLGPAGPPRLRFETLAGSVPVTTRIAEDGATATLTSVPTSTRPASDDELDRALRALHWERNDLDAGYPAHVAYAGNDHLVLALRDRERLAELDYDYPALAALMAERAWTTLQLVYPHTPVQFAARNPFPPRRRGGGPRHWRRRRRVRRLPARPRPRPPARPDHPATRPGHGSTQPAAHRHQR